MAGSAGGQLHTPDVHVPLQHPEPLQLSPAGRQQKLALLDGGQTAGGAHGAITRPR